MLPGALWSSLNSQLMIASVSSSWILWFEGRPSSVSVFSGYLFSLLKSNSSVQEIDTLNTLYMYIHRNNKVRTFMVSMSSFRTKFLAFTCVACSWINTQLVDVLLSFRTR